MIAGALASHMALAAQCTVLSVHDGDTLTADCGDGKVHVRLTEIDAPERTQPYSRLSTNHLKALCVGQVAQIDAAGIDKYGRTLGRVWCQGVDANAEQVRAGLAWAYDKYLTDPSIKVLEREAQEARRGLWRGLPQTPPWEFRHPR